MELELEGQGRQTPGNYSQRIVARNISMYISHKRKRRFSGAGNIFQSPRID